MSLNPSSITFPQTPSQRHSKQARPSAWVTNTAHRDHTTFDTSTRSHRPPEARGTPNHPNSHRFTTAGGREQKDGQEHREPFVRTVVHSKSTAHRQCGLDCYLDFATSQTAFGHTASTTRMVGPRSPKGRRIGRRGAANARRAIARKLVTARPFAAIGRPGSPPPPAFDLFLEIKTPVVRGTSPISSGG